MNYRRSVFNFLAVLFLEFIFGFFMYDNYMRTSIINIVIFSLISSTLITIITSIFNKKTNKVLTYVIYGIMFFWYCLNFIFYKFFNTPFSFSLFGLSDQVLQFGSEIIRAILLNFYSIVLFAIPIAILIIFKKDFKYNRMKFKNILVYIVIALVAVGSYCLAVTLEGKESGSAYNLIFESNNLSAGMERLGLSFSSILDIERSIFGFEEKIINEEDDPKEPENPEEPLFEYGYNNLELDFSGGSGDIKTINNYMNSQTGTKQNKYTGMFDGKNLIYIVAESFNEIAVREDLTPTLYKLVHEGFYFENFYSSTNYSTIGGEYQSITGLIADSSMLSTWRKGTNSFPLGLGNVFKEKGYSTYAYHDHSGYFQDRNVYLPSIGFTNFKACKLGLNINCNMWPESDVEMINATFDDYVNSSDPFMVYYMTVSGHMNYTKGGNAMTRKHWDAVKDLDYSDNVKGYLATQIELDKALETLMDKLKESGKLDDTVIVLTADHYPYSLTVNEVNEASSYKRDGTIEVNSNNLIIYNSKMKPVTVEKVGMSIDVLPTVYNLFNVPYDSRIIIGKDILSDTEGIAIFANNSWVTNKGTYNGKTFTGDADKEYIDRINNIVSNRKNISKLIMKTNYYKYILGQTN